MPASDRSRHDTVLDELDNELNDDRANHRALAEGVHHSPSAAHPTYIDSFRPASSVSQRSNPVVTPPVASRRASTSHWRADPNQFVNSSWNLNRLSSPLALTAHTISRLLQSSRPLPKY
jgi:hypothetical protein